MAHESGLNVEDVAQGGPGLAFVVYPTAVALMPFAAFWAFAFFFMLVLVGIDSQFVGVEGFIVAITDLLDQRVATKKNVRELITLVTCVISCIVGLSMVTRVSQYSSSNPSFNSFIFNLKHSSINLKFCKVHYTSIMYNPNHSVFL